MKLPRILRVRGKRAWYLIFAAFATFLIFSWSQQSDLQIRELDLSAPPKRVQENTFTTVKKPPVKVEEDLDPVPEKTKEVVKTLAVEEQHVVPSKTIQTPLPKPIEKPEDAVPQVKLPDRKKPAAADNVYGMKIHPADYPGRHEVPSLSATATIHWIKQPEHFAVPTESIIHLPTGKPIKIPKIQHTFNDETTDAKISREKRQSRVKAEFKKAWKGYREKAWLHDELSPVSGNFRDPFCGWAATLVDGLDTLWIMGLEEEFDEAARAVDLIDFTTSPRPDIPMFETTIRYLGGLIAAYDISEGRYKNLLTKAVELADILIGAFDTPNRMPILFYQWRPDFASQPHRASTRSNTAELGSLSMEFTRLAQLTKDPRYYDAIARVTNALAEWQNRGTPLPGVFPDEIDASGCNSTATLEKPIAKGRTTPLSDDELDKEPVGHQPLEDEKQVGAPKPEKADDASMLEMKVIPGQPSKAKIDGWTENHESEQENRPSKKRDLAGETPDEKLSNGTSTAEANVASNAGEWDCVPQGLEAANPYGKSRFSMGGGQDSTYEYWPKQYLLLGGREQKYGEMYLKTIEAVRKYMIYRPMIPGEKEILFSGAVSGSDTSDFVLIPEVEHLTCFIGGMIGMGAKIFGIGEDLELAKKLADGCVWAYSAFPSGIMPEAALITPCQNRESCPWNETFWRESSDFMKSERDEMVRNYIENKAAREAELAAEQKEAAKQKALAKDRPQVSAGEEIFGSASVDDTVVKPVEIDSGKENDLANAGIAAGKPKGYHQPKPTETPSEGSASMKDMGGEAGKPTEYHQSKRAETPVGSESLQKDTPGKLQKRAPIEEVMPEVRSEKSEPRPGDRNPEDVETPTPTSKVPKAVKPESAKMEVEEHDSKHPLHNIPTEERKYDDFVRVNEVASGRQAEIPLEDESEPHYEELEDPMMPLTHKQYVDSRIKQEHLVPGFTAIKSPKYILRPEAIESVWYMYRITGDPIWQEKGWKMFESIIAATSSEYGHSAVYDITATEPLQIDEMESFWLAETLKYFYLLYSTPDVVSLDEWVLNTEAHPFKRPV